MMAFNDLADYLGVTHQRVHQMSDQLPSARLIAGRRMWSRAGVEAWADVNWWGRDHGGSDPRNPDSPHPDLGPRGRARARVRDFRQR